MLAYRFFSSYYPNEDHRKKEQQGVLRLLLFFPDIIPVPKS
jgi:hypothetical protein